MAFKDTILPDFDREMDNTRRTLERVPDDKFSWQPHAKAGTLGWIAGHISNRPIWADMTMKEDSLNLAPSTGSAPTMPKPANRKELLANFEKNRADARAALAAADDAAYAKPWALFMGEQELFREPRAAVLRRMIFNHMIHHRGQLTVYLRLLDVPVPGLYGPSADEQKF